MMFCVCGADVEVMECLLRPYTVKTCTLTLADVGVMLDEVEGSDLEGVVRSERQEFMDEMRTGRNMFSPSLGSHSLCTAQPTHKIPGHTGYLTTATLY